MKQAWYSFVSSWDGEGDSYQERDRGFEHLKEYFPHLDIRKMGRSGNGEPNDEIINAYVVIRYEGQFPLPPQYNNPRPDFTGFLDEYNLVEGVDVPVEG